MNVKEIEIAEVPFTSATGKVPHRLTNDILFHIVMQRSEQALKGLVAALLGFRKDMLTSVTVRNPIHFGEHTDDKEIILDLEILLSDNTLINIEIQVMRFPYWTNRALYYSARLLVEQYPGKDYHGVRGVTHIGILDFHLFGEEEGFYSVYQLINRRTGKAFSDRLQIRVLDLNRTNLATEEDRQNGLVYWAELFKASTWEQIRGLAAMDDAIMDAAETMYKAESDEEMRSWLRRREMAVWDYNTLMRTSREEGMAEGFSKGRSEGRAEGRAEGIAEGRVEGRAEGIAEGRANILTAMLKSGDTVEQIVERYGIPETDVRLAAERLVSENN